MDAPHRKAVLGVQVSKHRRTLQTRGMHERVDVADPRNSRAQSRNIVEINRIQLVLIMGDGGVTGTEPDHQLADVEQQPLGGRRDAGTCSGDDGGVHPLTQPSVTSTYSMACLKRVNVICSRSPAAVTPG